MFTWAAGRASVAFIEGPYKPSIVIGNALFIGQLCFNGSFSS